MTDLTVVILTKNEEKNLRKCVESFRGVAKRFVIVDSFSTDGTEALCKELNTELQKIGSGLDTRNCCCASSGRVKHPVK